MNMYSYECCSNSKVQTKETKVLSKLLKLVSDNNRLQLLSILLNGEHCVCQLMEHVKLSQSLTSHHLKDLKEFGLVSDRKKGKWSYYALTPKGKFVTNLIFKMKI